MLALSKKTDYALISLAYLAEQAGRVASAREIGEGFQLPVAVVANMSDWRRARPRLIPKVS